MKAIIQINKKSQHNNTFKVLGSDILQLKICGKYLFSYYLDFLNELGVDCVYIFGTDLRDWIDDYYYSEVFPIKLEFISEDIDEFYIKNKNKLDEDLLIIKGVGFIFNSFNSLKEKILLSEENFRVEDRGFILEYVKEVNLSYTKSNGLFIKAINSIKDYVYVLDFVLKKLNNLDYTLGYSKKDGVIVGKNVQLDENVILIPPLILLDDVKLSNNCIIGPNVIVSENVYIESNTKIKDTLVYENTYIGANLDLENKIITGNRIIDKSTLKSFTIDKKLLSNNK